MSYILCVLVGAAHAGLFGGPDIVVSQVVPPRLAESNVTTLGMGDFNGPQADKVRDFLQAAILHGEGGRGYLPADGLTTQAVQVTGRDQAQGVVNATVSMPDPVERDYTEEHSKKVNEQTVKYYLYCKEREITPSVRMSVTRGDGTLLLQEERSNANKEHLCKESTDELKQAIANGELPTLNNMTEAALRPIAGSMANLLRPFHATFEIELLQDKAVKAGNKSAKDLLWPQAVGAWRQVLVVDPYNAIAHYNIAAAFEATENLDAAKEYYEKALQLSGEPRHQEKMNEGLQRIATRRAQIEVLTTVYGMTFTPVRLGAAATSSEAPAKRVTVKGNKNKRVPLRRSPAEGGAPVAQIPGGVALDLIEVEGAYVKVRAPDGKEGYLLEEEVDQ